MPELILAIEASREIILGRASASRGTTFTGSFNVCCSFNLAYYISSACQADIRASIEVTRSRTRQLMAEVCLRRLPETGVLNEFVIFIAE